MWFRSTRVLAPICFFAAIAAYIALVGQPPYTRWVTILFLIPSTFFIFRTESRLDIGKLSVICASAVGASLLWDHVAMTLDIWNFPPRSILGLFLGIPIEEYFFGICFSIITLGIYTSLPRFRKRLYDGPRFPDTTLLLVIFLLQLFALLVIWRSGVSTYLRWLLVFALIPSFFYLWRKGEKIDEMRLALTLFIWSLIFVPIDIIFISTNSWYYFDEALIGRIGIIPIDDLLFTFFTAITIVGFYTTLPALGSERKR